MQVLNILRRRPLILLKQDLFVKKIAGLLFSLQKDLIRALAFCMSRIAKASNRPGTQIRRHLARSQILKRRTDPLPINKYWRG